LDYLETRRRRRFRLPVLLALLFVLLIATRSAASVFIEYQWWKEIGQVSTWVREIAYGTLPVVLAVVLAFALLWVAHARALKRAGTGLAAHRRYALLATIVLLALAAVMAMALVDSWTVARYFGGRGAAESWRDAVFAKPLSFYFFELPFYRILLRFGIVLSAVTAILYWVTTRLWQLKESLPSWAQGGVTFDFGALNFAAAFQSRFFRLLAALFLFGLGASYFLDRYDLLFEDHGSLVGIDWVAGAVTLPLLWAAIAISIAGGVSLLFGKWKPLLALPAVWILLAIVPSLVAAAYVRPSEITIQKPYIDRHIQATRSAYGLTRQVREVDFAAKLEAPIDPSRHRLLLDNVRLWDWRAFHDTVTQLQALRPYYVFADTDVDRYQVDGKLRQVLLTPRELDVRQLPGDARSRWINPHFIYTHGYGLVVAEAARITRDGLPMLLVQNAPPEVKSDTFRLTRPELYYGEVTHEPVFVRTRQAEFNYPSGAGNVETRYEGKGGFSISGWPMRLAAALSTGDWNILLTGYLGGESRMMIRRKVRERLDALAEFIDWDSDPYLVVTSTGRMVWIVDGYTSSTSHPYSKPVALPDLGHVNYIRNAVKATVDAYDGTINLYLFDDGDPIIKAYQRLFPALLKPAAAMPADLRAHVRYPELIFRVQAEIYRIYHMRDPEAFFNKEDAWDLARNQSGSGARADSVTPTYLVATLPDSDDPEFLLMTSFTPRNKDNLIGLMVARCDGEHLGELLFLQLSKQELIFGPMQIEALINQDQTISKDLTLWNQQGSQVLRGQMLVLPVESTLLYIEPIYIQASEARMPQLKKVALAMGKRLIYTDTYEQAIAELTGTTVAQAARALTETKEPAQPPGSGPPLGKDTIDEIRRHFQRYRELSSQGKFADAGKEMEAIEQLLQRR
jgi:uncharacterized protein